MKELRGSALPPPRTSVLAPEGSGEWPTRRVAATSIFLSQGYATSRSVKGPGINGFLPADAGASI